MSLPARTPGELVFEEYLLSQGITDFEHEKQRPDKKKKPDYTVSLGGAELLFEIKDFDLTTIGAVGSSDPYERIREKIDEGREKFKEYKDWPCCLVLYNNNAPW